MNKDEIILQQLYMESTGATFNPSLGPNANSPMQDPILTKIDIEDVNTEDEEHDKIDDHEVDMAQSELYKLAEYAPKLLDMVGNYNELEGWVQAKITKASDYVSDIYHYLKYEQEGPGQDVEMDVEIQDEMPDENQALNDEIVKNLMSRF